MLAPCCFELVGSLFPLPFLTTFYFFFVFSARSRQLLLLFAPSSEIFTSIFILRKCSSLASLERARLMRHWRREERGTGSPVKRAKGMKWELAAAAAETSEGLVYRAKEEEASRPCSSATAQITITSASDISHFSGLIQCSAVCNALSRGCQLVFLCNCKVLQVWPIAIPIPISPPSQPQTQCSITLPIPIFPHSILMLLLILILDLRVSKQRRIGKGAQGGRAIG